MVTQNSSIPPELENRLKTLIAERAGLYFKDHDLRNLEDAIHARLTVRGFESVSAYYNCLMSSEYQEDELRELLNLLTINHTYFFRNEPQFKALREKILPEIIERKTY